MVTESGLSPVTLHGLGHGAATLALAVGAAGLAVLDTPDRSGFRLTYQRLASDPVSRFSVTT
jgi:hypothetical protein